MGLQNAQVIQMPDENKRLYILKVCVRCQGPLLEGLGDLILPRQGSAWGSLSYEGFSLFKKKETKVNIQNIHKLQKNNLQSKENVKDGSTLP